MFNCSGKQKAKDSLLLLFISDFPFAYFNAASQGRCFRWFQYIFKCAIQGNDGMSSYIHFAVFLSANTERKADDNS